MILITGAHKALALAKAVEEGVNHMWTVSAFQQHPQSLFICDEDATLELRVKTVKYFKVHAPQITRLDIVYLVSALGIHPSHLESRILRGRRPAPAPAGAWLGSQKMRMHQICFI